MELEELERKGTRPRTGHCSNVESGKKIEERGQWEESVELRGEVEGTKLEWNRTWSENLGKL